MEGSFSKVRRNLCASAAGCREGEHHLFILFKHMTLGGVNTLCEVWYLFFFFPKQKEM